MTASHAAAHGEIVAGQRVVFHDGDQPDVVREDVEVVDGRNDEGDLEFAGQISFAVERIDEILIRGVLEIELFAVDPDRVIGPGLRFEGVGHADTIRENPFTGAGVGGSGGREHVAVDVAARGESGEQCLVDGLYQRPQIVLHDAVELDALARRDPESVVAVSRGEIVEHGPLPGRHHPAGNAPANHHDIFLSGLAQVAIVLLIGTVKLEELVVILRKMIGGSIRNGGGDGPGESRDRVLDDLVMRHFSWRFCNH